MSFLQVSVPFYFLYFLTNRARISTVPILMSSKAVREMAFPIMSTGRSCSKVLLQRTPLVQAQDYATRLEPSPEKKKYE